MITLQQARAAIMEAVACRLDTQTVDLDDALGRVAAEDCVSELDIPPSDNSAMDGFAINAQDLVKGDSLQVSQRIPAGVQPQPLTAGSAARIFTGGVIPAGADAVVIQENCQYDESSVQIQSSVQTGDNIRPRGQDIQRGAVVVKRGKRLSAIDLSLLASVGIAQVRVYRRMKVAIFSTGDELIEPGRPLAPGQIYNSNRPLLLALCRQLGGMPFDCGIVQDTLPATVEALQQAAKEADLIISSGGVSVGEEDHVKPAVEQLGNLDLWKVQMKPGKPVAFGDVQGVPFIGLPGNPVSSFVVFQLLAKPLLQRLQGQTASELKPFQVIAGFDKALSSREEYIRVKLVSNDQGQWVADRFPNLSSGVMSSLSWADGLVRQAIDHSISTGQPVDFLPMVEGQL